MEKRFQEPAVKADLMNADLYRWPALLALEMISQHNARYVTEPNADSTAIFSRPWNTWRNALFSSKAARRFTIFTTKIISNPAHDAAGAVSAKASAERRRFKALGGVSRPLSSARNGVVPIHAVPLAKRIPRSLTPIQICG